MEPINSINQKLNIGFDANVNLGNVSKKSADLVNAFYPDNKIETISKETALIYPEIRKNQIVYSPKGVNDEVVSSLSKKESNSNVFKSIFNFLKNIATKLGGWDKFIDLILLLFPLPKAVRTILEILKKILPVLSPTAKEIANDFIFSALKLGNNKDTPEELLKKIIQAYQQKDEIKNEPMPKNEEPEEPEKLNSSSHIPNYDSIIADKNLSLEDKIMYILLTLAEQQEKEVLDQAKKLEKASPESRERIQVELQIKVQKLQQTFQALSNLLKTFHETVLNTIRNLR